MLVLLVIAVLEVEIEEIFCVFDCYAVEFEDIFEQIEGD